MFEPNPPSSLPSFEMDTWDTLYFFIVFPFAYIQAGFEGTVWAALIFFLQFFLRKVPLRLPETPLLEGVFVSQAQEEEEDEEEVETGDFSPSQPLLTARVEQARPTPQIVQWTRDAEKTL